MLPDPCKECGLHKTCKTHMVPGSGSDHPLVLFVGEAPGAEEDETGVVFMGKAGQVLREAINQLGLSDDQYRITNVVRCRPPKNRTPRAREIELCSEFLFEEIKQHPPKVIVLLGNTPLKAVLGENKISEWNGLAVQRGDFVYAPAFHPSAFNYGNRDRLEDWYDALEQAVRIAHGEKVPDRNAGWEYIYPKSYDDLVAMERELAKSETITYDVETRFLNIHDPENTVISVSFGMDGVAWSFPLYHTEGSEWWKGTRILSVVGMVLNILSKSQVVGQRQV